MLEKSGLNIHCAHVSTHHMLLHQYIQFLSYLSVKINLVKMTANIITSTGLFKSYIETIIGFVLGVQELFCTKN
jgi:hypothetical protein